MTLSPSERIHSLRNRCLERKKSLISTWPVEPRLTAQSLRNSEPIGSWQVRRGLLTRDRLAGLPLEVDDLELLMGRVAPDRPEWWVERQQAAAFLSEKYPNLYTPGQTGHCQLDLSRLFALGIDGLMTEIRARMDRAAEKERDVFLRTEYNQV